MKLGMGRVVMVCQVLVWTEWSQRDEAWYGQSGHGVTKPGMGRVVMVCRALVRAEWSRRDEAWYGESGHGVPGTH